MNQQQATSEQPKKDATMKAADAVESVTTGWHLSREQKEKAGPVVHYTFGGLSGTLYGAAAEYWPSARAAFGTTFASALFTGADLIAVPFLQLGPSPDEQPSSALASPFAAHLSTDLPPELVRRIVGSAI